MSHLHVTSQPDVLLVEKCSHLYPLSCCHPMDLTRINVTLTTSTFHVHRNQLGCIQSKEQCAKRWENDNYHILIS